MDKDVERVLLSQLEIQKQKLQNDIAELEKQINNNMSEQQQDNQVPSWASKQPKLEFKTLFNERIGQLDDEVTEYMNNGWQPAGPQYKADVTFYQPMILVPRPMGMK